MPFSSNQEFYVSPALFPPQTVPYLIVAPQYTGMSAGVRVMHMLCHSLNLIGQRAYVVTYPQLIFDTHQSSYTCPDLCTPIMTSDILSEFEKNGNSPIVVYLEAIRGNLLNATNVVRYVLNYPGLLGGDKQYADYEIPYAYSSGIAKSMGLSEDRVLFMPSSDPGIFKPAPAGTQRKGSCFYASKYSSFHHGKLLPITENSFEIKRFCPDALTKPQIAELFQRSEVFYTYEDTALVLEAALCGCPTVFIPNEFYPKPMSFEEDGMQLCAVGTAPEELERAKAAVANFPAVYNGIIANYWRQLEKFVAHTQAEALKNNVSANLKPILLPSSNRSHTIAYIADYIQQYGLSRFFIKSVKFLHKWGLRKVIANTFRNVLGS